MTNSDQENPYGSRAEISAEKRQKIKEEMQRIKGLIQTKGDTYLDLFSKPNKTAGEFEELQRLDDEIEALKEDQKDVAMQHPQTRSRI